MTADATFSAATGRWVLAGAIIGSGMAFVDGTVVNVALPNIQSDLGADVTELLWIVESYMLLLSALLLIGGVLGDIYGRRRVFAIGIALFGAASVWCAFAPDSGNLIAARTVQGFGAALLVPGSLSILSATFPEAERGKAIGTWSAFSALMVALGPVLGGWLIDHGTWRYVFLINIPFVLVVLWIVARHVPESRDENAVRRIDWAGVALATAGLAAVIYGLIDGGTFGFARPAIQAALVAGAVLLVAFVWWEARAPAPMMPLWLFRSRNFSGANLITLFLYAALGGGIFFLPFAMIQVYGYSATAAGAAFLPFIILLSTLSRWAGGLVAKVGGTLPLVVGCTLCAAGYALFAVPGSGNYWTTFFPATVVLGLGMSVAVAPLTTVVMTSLPDSRAGLASGVNNTAARLAGLIAVAAMGAVMTVWFNTRLDEHLAVLDLSQAAQQAIDAERYRLAGAELPAGLAAATAAALRTAIEESFLSGFRVVMLLAAALSLASAAAAGTMIRRSATTPAGPGP